MKTLGKEGLSALQVGSGSRKLKQVTAPLAGHFKAQGVPIKRALVEFSVTPDALLPVGTLLCASHFAAGQKVDVSGTTRGKGFAGGMKRHGFAGQGASHGNSVSHRAIGRCARASLLFPPLFWVCSPNERAAHACSPPRSTGNRQDPGRVWKGKKMPGHMGARRRTVQSVLVYQVDTARGLLYLKGAVPGHPGGWVEIRDAIRDTTLRGPFPTWVETSPGEAESMGVSTAAKADINPFEVLQPDRNTKAKAA